MQLPELPPESCFVADVDEQGRTRLSWAHPMRPGDYFRAFLFLVAAGCGLAFAVRNLFEPGGRVAARELPPFMIVFFLGFMFVIVVREVGRNLFYGPTPQRISFDTEALHFEPALRCGQPQAPRVEEVAREELGAIGLRQRAWRLLLTLDCGVWRLEVPRRLTEEEGAWLVGVLRAWAGRPEGDSSPGLRPPAGSWIRVEEEAGAWRLSWQPPTSRLASTLARWGGLVGLAHAFLFWVALTIILKVLLGGLLVQQLAGGRGWWAAVLLALLILLTRHSWTTLRQGFGEMRKILAKARPESLTLTATTLTHDPGHFLHVRGSGRYALHDGEPRTIPWSEIPEESLSLTEGSLRLAHDKDKLAIGTCLREPEREWLALVLRTWMGKSRM